jgi:hypothetical protein
MNYNFLYLGTFAMIFLSCTIIFFVLWASRQFNIQKKYNEERDKFYMKRIDVLENIVKYECRELVNQLKKI